MQQLGLATHAKAFAGAFCTGPIVGKLGFEGEFLIHLQRFVAFICEGIAGSTFCSTRLLAEKFVFRGTMAVLRPSVLWVGPERIFGAIRRADGVVILAVSAEGHAASRAVAEIPLRRTLSVWASTD